MAPTASVVAPGLVSVSTECRCAMVYDRGVGSYGSGRWSAPRTTANRPYIEACRLRSIYLREGLARLTQSHCGMR